MENLPEETLCYLTIKEVQRKIFLKIKRVFFSANYYKVYAYTLSYFQLHFYFLMLYESFAGVQMCMHKCLYLHRKGDVDIE